MPKPWFESFLGFMLAVIGIAGMFGHHADTLVLSTRLLLIVFTVGGAALCLHTWCKWFKWYRRNQEEDAFSAAMNERDLRKKRGQPC